MRIYIDTSVVGGYPRRVAMVESGITIYSLGANATTTYFFSTYRRLKPAAKIMRPGRGQRTKSEKTDRRDEYDA